ncbi:MAG: tropinesterase [Firmicutes bacterium]|nr:tropinesterase [Bacillota bacterium]
MLPEIKNIKLSNQLELQYAEKGKKEGVALILLHGFGDSWKTFGLLLPHIPDSIRAIALTMRGHGDSDKPEKGYRTRDFEEDLLLFMDALRIEKAVIAGASSGGFTARSFALHNPQRTLGLVLIGAPAELRNNKMARSVWESEISKLTDPIGPEFLKMFAGTAVSDRIPKEFLESMTLENLKVPARVWKESNLGFFEEEFPGELNKIDVPALILWGGKDNVADRVSQVLLSQAIPGSKLVVYEGAGHLLYWDEPSSVAADMAAFIDSVMKIK